MFVYVYYADLEPYSLLLSTGQCALCRLLFGSDANGLVDYIVGKCSLYLQENILSVLWLTV